MKSAVLLVASLTVANFARAEPRWEFTASDFESSRPDGRFENTTGFVLDRFRKLQPELAFEKLRSADELPAWREKVRARLRELLGLGDWRCADFKKLSESPRDGYVLERWEMYPEEGLVVPFYKLVPDAARRPGAKVPAVLCLPGSGYSAESLAGEPDRYYTMYPRRNKHAYYYAKAGMIAIALENPATDNNTAPGLNYWYSRVRYFELMKLAGRSQWGLLVGEALSCLEHFKRDPTVDPRRIAIAGLSLGISGTLYTTVLSDDVAAAVHNNMLCPFQRRHSCVTERRGDGTAYAAQPLYGATRFFDDDTDLMCAVAPRPYLLAEGGLIFNGIDKVKRAYALAGRPDALGVHWYDRYADPSSRRYADVDVAKVTGLDGDQYLTVANCDAREHSFHSEYCVPWLCRQFFGSADLPAGLVREMNEAAKDKMAPYDEPPPGDPSFLAEDLRSLDSAEQPKVTFLDGSPAMAVSAVLKDARGRRIVVASNRTDRAVTVRIGAPDDGARRIEVVGEGRFIPSAEGLVDRFAPREGHIYRLGYSARRRFRPEDFETRRPDGRFEQSMAFVHDLLRRIRPDLQGGTVRSRLTELLELENRQTPKFARLSASPRDGYVLERWEMYPEEGLVVPFLKLVPDAVRNETGVPAVVCIAGNGGTLESLAGEPERDFHGVVNPPENAQALAFARAGMIAVAVELPASGSNVERHLHWWSSRSYCLELMTLVGRSYWGLAVASALGAVDHLAACENVGRIAVCGHNFAARAALYATVLCDRVDALVHEAPVRSEVRSHLAMTNALGKVSATGAHHLFGAIRYFDDEPDLIAAVAPRPVYVPDDKNVVRPEDATFDGESDSRTFNAQAVVPWLEKAWRLDK